MICQTEERILRERSTATDLESRTVATVCLQELGVALALAMARTTTGAIDFQIR